MVGRNIVVGGMSGGSGHVGMATQGFGGVYTAPPVFEGLLVNLRAVKRLIGLGVSKRDIRLEVTK